MARIIFAILLSAICSIPIYAQKKELGLKLLMQDKGYDGIILLYDYNKDGLFASHINKTDERVLPASTFKIFNSLVFLDLGIIRDTSFTLPWNGIEDKHKGRRIPRWYKDHNLAEAFRNSTVWYYKQLSVPIDLKIYKKLMKKNKYGRVYGREKTELDFWNQGSKIGVSARDQINFLVKIKDDNLSFQSEHVEIVKKLMVVKETENYIFRAKSGWTITPGSKFKDGIDLGWYIGYVEYDNNSYFFAIRLEKELNDKRDSFANDRIEMAKRALSHQFGLDFQ